MSRLGILLRADFCRVGRRGGWTFCRRPAGKPLISRRVPGATKPTLTPTGFFGCWRPNFAAGSLARRSQEQTLTNSGRRALSAPKRQLLPINQQGKAMAPATRPVTMPKQPQPRLLSAQPIQPTTVQRLRLRELHMPGMRQYTRSAAPTVRWQGHSSSHQGSA